mgnify:CR=1 FL=1
MDWQPLLLSFKLAGLSTALLLLIGIPISYFLARSSIKVKPVIEALIGMPLVLPPTVLGFYLLLAFSPGNAFGQWLEEWFSIRLVFSFGGLVLASVIYSLPFMIQPLQAGFKSIPTSLNEAAQVLGKSQFQIIRKVLLPNMKPALLNGIVLSFAHTLGEFGVVLMIGGNIPGETRVASIAIYDEVEALNYAAAGTYSAVLFIISFSILLMVYMSQGGLLKRLWS